MNNVVNKASLELHELFFPTTSSNYYKRVLKLYNRENDTEEKDFKELVNQVCSLDMRSKGKKKRAEADDITTITTTTTAAASTDEMQTNDDHSHSVVLDNVSIFFRIHNDSVVINKVRIEKMENNSCNNKEKEEEEEKDDRMNE